MWLEACERFPNNEAFGYWAWSIRDWNRALKKYNELEGITEDESTTK
jgi:hypothetical protein